MSRARRWASRIFVGLLALLAISAGVSAWLNRGYFEPTGPVWVLDGRDEALLREAIHLRRQLGNEVWPGWGDALIPVVVYNDDYVFLIGLADPSHGWVGVTDRRVHGGSWEPVSTDSFAGGSYHRQPIPATGEGPQAFTVLVGERWTASMQTYDWLRISLAERFRSSMPRPLRPVFPYGLVVKLFTGGGEGYAALVSHEAFHAYQGMRAPQRLLAAERATVEESRYPDDDGELREAWRREMSLVARALRAEDDSLARALAGEFLRARAERRSAARLSAQLTDYERQREWLEGLAKYAELSIWRRAADDSRYRPVLSERDVKGFRDYRGFPARWSQELITMKNADRGDVRFYYSGMAQAMLLDRFAPGWKDGAFAEAVWLESLLESSLSGKFEEATSQRNESSPGED